MPIRLRHRSDLEWIVLFLHLRSSFRRSDLSIRLFLGADLEHEQPIVELYLHRAATGADMSVRLRLGTELG